MFSDVGDSTKEYKTAIFKPTPSKFLIFLAQFLDHQHIQAWFVEKPWSRSWSSIYLSSLGPFKASPAEKLGAVDCLSNLFWHEIG